jgi:hypothetical protein
MLRALQERLEQEWYMLLEPTSLLCVLSIERSQEDCCQSSTALHMQAAMRVPLTIDTAHA